MFASRPTLLPKPIRFGTPVIAACLFVFGAGSLAAQAQRTFVSTAGSDANTPVLCSRSFPCRSFGAAASTTSTGGEIVVLDSGGYGSVLIEESISIISPEGVHAALTAFSGSAITIDAPSSVVILRNLTLTGLGADHGIQVIDLSGGGALVLESMDASGFNMNGVDFAVTTGGSLHVHDSVFRNNGGAFHSGIYLSGGATSSSSQRVKASITDSRFERNGNGIAMDRAITASVRGCTSAGNLHAGFFIRGGGAQTPLLLIDDSTSTGNVYGYYVEPPSLSNPPETIIRGSSLAQNEWGIYLTEGTLYLADSVVTSNFTAGARIEDGGTLFSTADNLIEANVLDIELVGTGAFSVVAKE